MIARQQICYIIQIDGTDISQFGEQDIDDSFRRVTCLQQLNGHRLRVSRLLHCWAYAMGTRGVAHNSCALGFHCRRVREQTRLLLHWYAIEFTRTVARALHWHAIDFTRPVARALIEDDLPSNCKIGALQALLRRAKMWQAFVAQKQIKLYVGSAICVKIWRDEWTTYISCSTF